MNTIPDNIFQKVLRDYQEDAVQKVLSHVDNSDTNALVGIATAGGKTLVMAEVARRYGKRVLCLAHIEPLFKQLMDAFLERGLSVSVEKGPSKCTDTSDVVVASVQTACRKNRLQQHFDLVLVDEAHRATATTYVRVYEKVGAKHVIGFSATPYRSTKQGNRDLDELFSGGIIYKKTAIELQREGYLCPLHGKIVPLPAQEIKMRSSMGDFHQEDLSTLLDTDAISDFVTSKWSELASKRKTLVFCINILHAERVTSSFERAGIKVVCAHGKQEDCMERMDAFARGEYQVMIGVAMFTEGYDCPSVDCILMVRPTKSKGLYVQIVGRGMRLYSGKSDLLLIDFTTSSTKHAVGLSDIPDIKVEPEEKREDRERPGPGTPDTIEQRLAKNRPTHEEEFSLELLQYGQSCGVPATDKQRWFLIKYNRWVDGISKSQASVLIDHIKNGTPLPRPDEATHKQKWRLRSLGLDPNVTRHEAKRLLTRAKAKGLW